jgi:hypothetical protein
MWSMFEIMVLLFLFTINAGIWSIWLKLVSNKEDL